MNVFRDRASGVTAVRQPLAPACPARLQSISLRYIAVFRDVLRGMLMGKVMGLAVAVGLVAVQAPARAGDSAEARAVLDRAIKALGGADKLAGLGAVTWKGKGTITVRD